MYTFLIIAIAVICVLVILRIVIIFSDKIKFFTTGFDSGFKFHEISLLWKLAQTANLEEPLALFWSVPALNHSISVILQTSKESGIEKDKKTQDFLSRLYNYRTKIELEPDNKQKLKSTKYLDNGQRLRIILKGKGVFSSSILNNSRDMIITMPLQDGKITVSGDEWIGKLVSVYLWRKDDAGYTFDTFVISSNQFNSRNALYLEQTENLVRTQKRKSVRSECKIIAQMYFIKSETQGYTTVETEPGFKCLIEDISEDGALIRVGGKGQSNKQIKIQFAINEKTVVMFGVIKAVEFNKEKNQSRLHLQCIRIEPDAKNAILSFVYNLIPQNEREIYDAFRLTEEDKNNEDAEKNAQDLVKKFEQTETMKNEEIEEAEPVDEEELE